MTYREGGAERPIRVKFSSTGRLEHLTFTSPTRSLTYSVVFLEPALEAELFAHDGYSHLIRGGRLRFIGEVEDVPVQLAWQPARDRGHYVMLSPALCKQLALRIGSEVTVRFDLVDPSVVSVPHDIRDALGLRPADAKKWATLSPGHQRALIAYVSSARTEKTRRKRIADLFAPLARMPAARRAAPRPSKPRAKKARTRMRRSSRA